MVGKLLTVWKLLVSTCGGWWSIMSGALSIPFAFVALFVQGRERTIFAVLGFCALWIFALRLAWKNYEISTVQNRERKATLFTRMVDWVKSSSAKDQNTRRPSSFTTYDYMHIMQPGETIGALIKYVNEIKTEDELEWICQQFEKHGYKAPLKNFQPILDAELQGQWLPVLQEARLRPDEIQNETQFLSFLSLTWSGKEKWKRGQERIRKAPTEDT